MGILDEAIREHIDLKRKHGAAESEVRKLEDDAFGLPVRPGDPEAGAATAIADEAVETVPPEAEPPVAPAGEDMPPTEIVSPQGEAEPEAPAPPEPAPEPPAPPTPEPPAAEEALAEPPVEEQQPAMEHPTVLEPEPPPAEVAPPEPEAPAAAAEETSTVDQPTEFYDYESEMSEGESPSQRPRPSESLGERPSEEPEQAEAPSAAESEDDPLSEQSLSDELDRALEAPETEEAPAVPEPAPEPPPPEDEAEVVEPAPPPAEPTEEEPVEEHDFEEGGEEDEHFEGEDVSEDKSEDVLEETPEFLQDTPEHDRLWFEQKPPKDFDFDD
jgi:hypothetical protein